MGATQSGQIQEIEGKKEFKEMKSLMSNIVNLLLHSHETVKLFADEDYCKDIMILSSDVLSSLIYSKDIEYLEKETELGSKVNKMKKERTSFINKKLLKELLDKDSISNVYEFASEQTKKDDETKVITKEDIFDITNDDSNINLELDNNVSSDSSGSESKKSKSYRKGVKLEKSRKCKGIAKYYVLFLHITAVIMNIIFKQTPSINNGKISKNISIDSNSLKRYTELKKISSQFGQLLQMMKTKDVKLSTNMVTTFKNLMTTICNYNIHTSLDSMEQIGELYKTKFNIKTGKYEYDEQSKSVIDNDYKKISSLFNLKVNPNENNSIETNNRLTKINYYKTEVSDFCDMYSTRMTHSIPVLFDEDFLDSHYLKNNTNRITYFITEYNKFLTSITKIMNECFIFMIKTINKMYLFKKDESGKIEKVRINDNLSISELNKISNEVKQMVFTYHVKTENKYIEMVQLFNTLLLHMKKERIEYDKLAY